jgi:hypothetical protein
MACALRRSGVMDSGVSKEFAIRSVQSLRTVKMAQAVVPRKAPQPRGHRRVPSRVSALLAIRSLALKHPAGVFRR